MKEGLNTVGNYHIYMKPSDCNVGMLSAVVSGKENWQAVTKIENIDRSDILWYCKGTANYRQMSDGQHLGVEVSKENEFVPRQGWLVLYQRHGVISWCYDSSFWYGKDSCEWACSPASIFLDTGASYFSNIEGVKEAKANEVTTQSAFGLLKDSGEPCIITCLYKVSAKQMWQDLKEYFSLLAVMDGGGSAQMQYVSATGSVGTFKASNRELPNVLCFYKDKGSKPTPTPEPTTKTYTEDDINNAIDKYFSNITIDDLKTELKKGIKENL